MLKSFIHVPPESHFPIQNLPYGAYKTDNNQVHLCSAIGDYIVDLFILEDQGLFDGPLLNSQYIFRNSSLNEFMGLGKKAWQEARHTIQTLLSEDISILRDDKLLRERVLIKRENVELVLPVQIGDYTDFYSSEQHARNVGSMFRDPENALMPNWKHLPVGYHGRASSIVISGTNVHRPQGQTLPENSNQPVFAASSRVDFELETGFFTGPGNIIGEPIPIHKATDHIFGMVLLNDWSARDLQTWEYKPLGPFLAKNWATSISPWIIPLEALKPFEVKAPDQSPRPLDYLNQPSRKTFDLQLEVYIETPNLEQPSKLSSTNFRELYWTMQQQLAHQTITGCNVRPGDLYGSGTISGNTADAYGSMLELAWNGTKPIELPSGEKRTFLEDGDEIIMTGFAQSDGYRVGFGEVRGKLLPPKK